MSGYIISSAPIEYTIGSLDLYDSFDQVSQGKLEAPLRTDSCNLIKNVNFDFDIDNIKIIRCAPIGQTFETAKLLKTIICPNVIILPIRILNPISFSMTELIKKDNFVNMKNSEALQQARKVFAEKLFTNELSESFDEILQRIKELKSLAKDDTLFIGHSFFMKILFIELNNPKALKEKNLFVEAFEPEKRPYDFLTGFKITD